MIHAFCSLLFCRLYTFYVYVTFIQIEFDLYIALEFLISIVNLFLHTDYSQSFYCKTVFHILHKHYCAHSIRFCINLNKK